MCTSTSFTKEREIDMIRAKRKYGLKQTEREYENSINMFNQYNCCIQSISIPQWFKKKMFYEPHISLNLFCELCTFSEALVPCERNKYQFCHQNNKLQP